LRFPIHIALQGQSIRRSLVFCWAILLALRGAVRTSFRLGSLFQGFLEALNVLEKDFLLVVFSLELLLLVLQLDLKALEVDAQGIALVIRGKLGSVAELC
jgi:hypothetical protein